jgi:uncharacterized protein (TIGR02246 family)
MNVESEIARLLDRYVEAYRTGDSAGCAAAFTEDGELRSPFGPAAVGRDAIARVHAEWTADGAAGKQIEIKSFGMSGDMAWVLAVFREGQATGEGESLCVLERQADQGWLFRMCSLTP